MMLKLKLSQSQNKINENVKRKTKMTKKIKKNVYKSSLNVLQRVRAIRKAPDRERQSLFPNHKKGLDSKSKY